MMIQLLHKPLSITNDMKYHKEDPIKDFLRPPWSFKLSATSASVVVQFEKDPCQGTAFRRADKPGDSITREHSF